jgi:uncharacterized protein (TIGR00251 family)
MHNVAVWETEEGVFLRVLVKPKSTLTTFISEISETVVIVNLKSPARDGKANSELLKRMSKVLGISTGDIKLTAGHKSREKTLFIKGIELKDVTENLAEFQGQTNR